MKIHSNILDITKQLLTIEEEEPFNTGFFFTKLNRYSMLELRQRKIYSEGGLHFPWVVSDDGAYVISFFSWEQDEAVEFFKSLKHFDAFQ